MKSPDFVRECLPNIKLLEIGQVPDLRRDRPGKFVPWDGEVLQELPPAVFWGDAAWEEVAAEVEVAQGRHLVDDDREWARHVVVVEVEDLEVLQEG